MKRPGSAECSCDVGLLSTISAYKLRYLLQIHNLFCVAGLGKFANMQLMVVRVGAKIVDIDKSSAHAFSP
jgi:hypothetical protein